MKLFRPLYDKVLTWSRHPHAVRYLGTMSFAESSFFPSPVDVMLALLLMSSAVVGAQFGTRIGAKMKGEQVRSLLAFLVLLVCAKIAADLVLTPDDVYSFSTIGGNR